MKPDYRGFTLVIAALFLGIMNFICSDGGAGQTIVRKPETRRWRPGETTDTLLARMMKFDDHDNSFILFRGAKVYAPYKIPYLYNFNHGLASMTNRDMGMSFAYDKNCLAMAPWRGSVTFTLYKKPSAPSPNPWLDDSRKNNIFDGTSNPLLITYANKLDSFVVVADLKANVKSDQIEAWQPFIQFAINNVTPTGFMYKYEYPTKIEFFVSANGSTWLSHAVWKHVNFDSTTSVNGLWIGPLADIQSGVWRYCKIKMSNFTNNRHSQGYMYLLEAGMRHPTEPTRNWASSNIYRFIRAPKDSVKGPLTLMPSNYEDVLFFKNAYFKDDTIFCGGDYGTLFKTLRDSLLKIVGDSIKVPGKDTWVLFNKQKKIGADSQFVYVYPESTVWARRLKIPNLGRFYTGSLIYMYNPATTNYLMGVDSLVWVKSKTLTSQISAYGNVFAAGAGKNFGKQNATNNLTRNTLFGYNAGLNCGAGTTFVHSNNVFGAHAMENFAVGDNVAAVENNTAIGCWTMTDGANGGSNHVYLSGNTAVGTKALYQAGLQTGKSSAGMYHKNTAVGFSAGSKLGQAANSLYGNTMLGALAGCALQDTSTEAANAASSIYSNTAIGNHAMSQVGGANFIWQNTFIGASCGNVAKTNSGYNLLYNTALGFMAMHTYYASTGQIYNVIAIGSWAGFQKSGNYKLYIGRRTSVGVHFIEGSFSGSALTSWLRIDGGLRVVGGIRIMEPSDTTKSVIITGRPKGILRSTQQTTVSFQSANSWTLVQMPSHSFLGEYVSVDTVSNGLKMTYSNSSLEKRLVALTFNCSFYKSSSDTIEVAFAVNNSVNTSTAVRTSESSNWISLDMDDFLEVGGGNTVNVYMRNINSTNPVILRNRKLIVN